MPTYKLPPVLSGEESKNNEIIIPTKARDIKYVRPSSLNTLRDCPDQFYSKFCEGLPQPTRPGPNYAFIGTVFHEVIESYILDGWEISDSHAGKIQQELLKHKIRENEIKALGNYLLRIRDLRPFTYKVEFEFDYNLATGFPRIKGHIDWICDLPDYDLVIDHKTNRQPKQINKWMDDLQTRSYGWATRRKRRTGKPIHFKIGYVNLHYDADWIIDKSFDNALQIWYKQAWKKLLKMEERGQFEQTACDTCKYCPQSGVCEVERHGKKVNKSLLSSSLEKLKK